ncbi:hypothetical protein Tel_02910 [Candidatus Tenderia electrophaga]|jgi:hypothetical protein|uniref:Methyltransferase FkbM domain-containing protein n=1 Tax=Candidatus Tenderia electrophaga TaxID=1748243 RepID=A0A0S2TAP2_9GAMM|nr:hypothetical protein Tel_02910 [Candidatus Tenderia electrophaga]
MGRYRTLHKDFKNPLRALYAASGAPRAPQTLITKEGSEINVDRGDVPIWEAYFSSRTCRVEIETSLFKIIPNHPDHPPYYIRGCAQGFTHEPERWCKREARSPLIAALEAAEASIYSQHGEDGVVQRLLEHIPAPHRCVVEFGAYDGICMSNSRHLLSDKGWGGFLIEADKRFFADLSKLYGGNNKVTLHNGFVTEENINDLFRQADVPVDFEVLSIDIDSIDYYVWRGLTEFRPKIVIIEYNSSILPDKEYVVPKADAARLGATSKEGASILSLYKLALAKGYRLVYGELSGANLFFLHESCTEHLDLSGIELVDTYQPPQFGVLAGGEAPNGRGYPAPK